MVSLLQKITLLFQIEMVLIINLPYRNKKKYKVGGTYNLHIAIRLKETKGQTWNF